MAVAVVTWIVDLDGLFTPPKIDQNPLIARFTRALADVSRSDDSLLRDIIDTLVYSGAIFSPLLPW